MEVKNFNQYTIINENDQKYMKNRKTLILERMNVIKNLEKLISLYLPELSNFFKNNSIITNFYASPWFITLFTSTMNKNIKLEIIMKIFDNFFLDQWKTIYNTSLILLESKEQLILTMKNEAILQFITGNLILDELYGDSSNSFFSKINKSSQIKNKLIQNIFNEIKYDNDYENIIEKNDTNNNSNNDSNK